MKKIEITPTVLAYILLIIFWFLNYVSAGPYSTSGFDLLVGNRLSSKFPFLISLVGKVFVLIPLISSFLIKYETSGLTDKSIVFNRFSIKILKMILFLIVIAMFIYLQGLVYLQGKFSTTFGLWFSLLLVIIIQFNERIFKKERIVLHTIKINSKDETNN